MLGLFEIGGALLMLWGGVGPDWSTRLAGLIFTGIMIGAIVMVHAQYGWNSINMGDNGGRGMEFQVLIIAVSLLYAFKGNAISRAVASE
jgi:putative oxidoreductase